MTQTDVITHLTQTPADAEQILSLQLNCRDFSKYTFQRQFAIEPYIVDFICHELKLIIELNGSQHLPHQDRQIASNSSGFKVITLCNDDLLTRSELVLDTIRLAITEQERNFLSTSLKALP